MTRVRLRWAVAFLIGLSTVTAATFAWRSAQIGSTAAFDDRQAISETVAVEQDRVERIIVVAAQEREYARYRADYAVAASLDREAARLAVAGDTGLADVSRTEADALREGATRRAAKAGVFGPFTISSDLLQPTPKPRSFDPRVRARALADEASTSLDSPGKLDPDAWATSAHDIRDRMAGLMRGALVVLLSILLYTLAEISWRMWAAVAWTVAGIAVYLAGVVGVLATVF